MHAHLNQPPALLHAIQTLERLNPDQFEIYLENRTATQIDSKNQAMDCFTRSEDVGLAIRLVKDQKLGFSFTTRLDPLAIERTIQIAYDIAQLMPTDPSVDLYAFGNAAYPHVDQLDLKGWHRPLAEKIALAHSLEAQCRAADQRVAAVRHASITEALVEVHLIDSNGEHIHHKNTEFTAALTCKADLQGDSQMGNEFSFSYDLDHLDISGTASRAARWATELLGATSAPTLKCPAVLRNSVVAELIDFLSSSFSAEEVLKGRSLFKNQIGQPLFSEKMTLINDGLFPGGAGTGPFDAEGIPTKKTTLVDGGFLSAFLCDSYSGRKLKMTPTGSSVRSVKTPPSIGFSNLYLKQGKGSPDELLDGISNGIFLTQLMGLHTANPVTGDFSLGASGILIENGKLTRPVRGFAVAGNVIELFRKITNIGDDLKFFGKIGAPSIRLSEMVVGGS